MNTKKTVLVEDMNAVFCAFIWYELQVVKSNIHMYTNQTSAIYPFSYMTYYMPYLHEHSKFIVYFLIIFNNAHGKQQHKSPVTDWFPVFSPIKTCGT